ncbi:MAG: LLM class flavin-dependent oxidoreductase, partial [Solirubrobacterales bacterium]|nr:LLM class flavin-dependent oxidoreductase [Solirubrobacterales bacterium]
MPKEIRLNAFDMNCVAHQSPGLWRHPQDQSWRYKTIDYWTGLARTLERGLFDGIFIADVLGLYDVYGGNRDAALRNTNQIPVNDPVLLVSAMAAVTEHLGFGVTVGTAFEHPFPYARRVSTLDHLTNGRFAWNVVTGYLPSVARAMGESEHTAHDARYDHADEYMEVTYKLWEGSWEDDAVVRDAERGVFVEPGKVHEISHHGRYFDVDAIHLCEPSPQRTPFIYQAGSSPRGLKFAIDHAEAIFIASPSREVAAQNVRKIREGLAERGRDPQSIKVFQMLTVITGETAAEAQAKHERLRALTSDEGALVFMSGWMGVDLSAYDLDDPIGAVESNAIQSAVAAFQAHDDSGKQWTVRDIARWGGIGGMGALAVGSPAEVADELQSWVEETDIDGFNLPYAITPGTFEDVVDHIVPELQRRGLYKTEYAPGTLRNKLFGRG